jgi:hypothetical protein
MLLVAMDGMIPNRLLEPRSLLCSVVRHLRHLRRGELGSTGVKESRVRVRHAKCRGAGEIKRIARAKRRRQSNQVY